MSDQIANLIYSSASSPGPLLVVKGRKGRKATELISVGYLPLSEQKGEMTNQIASFVRTLFLLLELQV